jgi:hypothetical protein
MIELAFGESPAGGLKIAKSMKQGECFMNGAVAVFGSTAKERREAKKEAKKPRIWSGVTLEGSPGDVAVLTLALDMGDILDMDTGMNARKMFLDLLFADYPGVSGGGYPVGGILCQHDDRLVFRDGLGQAVRSGFAVHSGTSFGEVDAQQSDPESD